MLARVPVRPLFLGDAVPPEVMPADVGLVDETPLEVGGKLVLLGLAFLWWKWKK